MGMGVPCIQLRLVGHWSAPLNPPKDRSAVIDSQLAYAAESGSGIPETYGRIAFVTDTREIIHEQLTAARQQVPTLPRLPPQTGRSHRTLAPAP